MLTGMVPTVLIPGLLGTAELFAPQVAALWPYGPVTVASTLEGSTIAEMAAAILASAPPRFALAGISMGGYISFEIMRQAPERVLKLALLSTHARPDTPEQTAQRRVFAAQASTLGPEAFAALIAPTLKALLHPAHQNDPAFQEGNVRMGRTVGVAALQRQLAAVMGRVDSRPSLPAISVPTLVLLGDGDPLIPLDRAEEMATAIPDARLVVVPECGHLSTLEQPEAVNRALIEWITG
jgi:pimeloyl-ACP methyl ester carboxylesterase